MSLVMRQQSRLPQSMCSDMHALVPALASRHGPRVGPGPRPTELCYWEGYPARPKPGQPGQECVEIPDKALLRKWRRKLQLRYIMRNPKKGGKPAPKPKAAGSGKKSKKDAKPQLMETDTQPSTKSVWRPGVDPVGEDEELDYDRTAYDCLHRLELDWPCLSFDLIKDDLGGPRSTFPHSLLLAAGTQAATAKQNYLAFLRLANLGQGRHGKKAQKAADGSDSSSDEDDDDDGDSMSGSEGEGEEGERKERPGLPEVDLVFGPPRMHFRMVQHQGGINRVRSCPHKPGLVAVWADTALVRLYDGTRLLHDMQQETESSNKNKARWAVGVRTRGAGQGQGGGYRRRVDLKPVAQHAHAMEGFALDWSPLAAGRLASGDCRKHICVWEPSDAGCSSWSVSAAYAGHEASVEDLQWSPTETTVFASCSCDHTLRVWDTRERSKPMITVKAHECDVNVVSWNRLVTYMLASGGDDGSLRIWDLRNFTQKLLSARLRVVCWVLVGPAASPLWWGVYEQDGPVSDFAFHRSHITGVEWCPYEGSMLASCAADNQLAVWDLALERDPEEEAALAPEGNAAAPEDLPAQLLFLHAGQKDLKECHWHAQIPGMIVSTAGDGFNVFKASNM
ncbi:hypothetical protein QJQ45_028716 [Haematococcus lacustris]|nr:hypothetical protein QJQ45_028716 [Haematococcus lacustris]